MTNVMFTKTLPKTEGYHKKKIKKTTKQIKLDSNSCLEESRIFYWYKRNLHFINTTRLVSKSLSLSKKLT